MAKPAAFNHYPRPVRRLVNRNEIEMESHSVQSRSTQWRIVTQSVAGHQPPCPNLHYLPLQSIKQISAVQRQFQLFRFSISVISFLSLSLSLSLFLSLFLSISLYFSLFLCFSISFVFKLSRLLSAISFFVVSLKGGKEE